MSLGCCEERGVAALGSRVPRVVVGSVSLNSSPLADDMMLNVRVVAPVDSFQSTTPVAIDGFCVFRVPRA